jgi:hypothetical protein
MKDRRNVAAWPRWVRLTGTNFSKSVFFPLSVGGHWIVRSCLSLFGFRTTISEPLLMTSCVTSYLNLILALFSTLTVFWSATITDQ